MNKNERDQVLDSFDHLIKKYFKMVGLFSNAQPPEGRLKGLINVGWTAVQACGKQVKEAIESGKPLTEVTLIIFRFEQQLDALDPLHPFVPNA
jgi:hypothetical protein